MSRNYEFEAELEDHEIGSQEIYRLYYINYHRVGENYLGRSDDNSVIVDWPFKPFMFPEGMSREDGFKVLSYLIDFIEKQLNLKPCSCKGLSILNSVLDVERLGFKRPDGSNHIDASDIIDLFTVTGRLLLFKNSEHYKKYFEWYSEGITVDEVKEIYANCGIEFYDLVLLGNSEETKVETPSGPQLLFKK